MVNEQGPYMAEIVRDPEIESTSISLLYEDREDPSRSITVSIAPELGSNMFRLRVGAHDIIHCETELLKRRGFTGNFVLWPLPNRVRDKRYTYQGNTYSLQDVKRLDKDPFLIHGLVFDQVWHYEQPVVEPHEVRVTTYVDVTAESPFYANYPFESRLSLTYTLTKEGITVTYHVQNTGEKDLPFGFALHPYFATLSGPHDTFVSIPAGVVMEADNDLLPTGRLLDVDTVMYRMFDVRQPQPVGNLKLDHVYTALERTRAMIDYRKHGFQLHISGSDEFTHCVVYTLGGPAFLCVEYQTCSTDAINFHTQGPEREKMAHLLELHPGAVATGSLHYVVRFV